MSLIVYLTGRPIWCVVDIKQVITGKRVVITSSQTEVRERSLRPSIRVIVSPFMVF
jgi:hypothetical protein